MKVFVEADDLSPASQALGFSLYGSPRSASLRVGLILCPAASQPRRPIVNLFLTMQPINNPETHPLSRRVGILTSSPLRRE